MLLRCKIPSLENDTYEIMGEWHRELVDKYVPKASGKSFKGPYDTCNLKVYFNDTDTNNEYSMNFTANKCDKWVYSKKYYESTLNSHVLVFFFNIYF